MSQTLQRAWARRGLLSWLLWPLSLVFGVVVAIRRLLYRLRLLRTSRMPVPVIVVGNVVVGGAGKTPVVIALVEHLKARGLKVGIVSRGHARESQDCREVMAQSAPGDVGDEPLLLKRRTDVPVFVSADRVEAAKRLLDSYPYTEVLVADDGLQHYALARDIEVCVVDERGQGNGFLLPAGPLREPASRKTDLVLGGKGHRIRRTLAPYAEAANGIRIPIEDLKGRKLKALAGIAKPEAFFGMLESRGLRFDALEPLPDHHDYSEMRPPEERSWTLVTTEKDAVKLWRQRPDAFAVPLVVEIDGAFFTALDRLLDAKLSSKKN